MLTIYVVSDATGGTAERVIRAALTQFNDAQVELIQLRDVRTPERVGEVVRQAAEAGAMVVHTLVSNELRGVMLEQARLHDVDAMDMLGPLLDRLATHLKLTPQEKPGLFRQLGEARKREIEAVDFAFAHDDGRNADELGRAEVVLVGVSRSMKTPTMLYLAYHGWFAANVPLIPEMPLPKPVLALPAQRVFCLVMSQGRLVELRRARAETEGIPAEPYASPEYVRKELQYARRISLERDWRVIDATGKSVEEVGREIITLLPERKKGEG